MVQAYPGVCMWPNEKKDNMLVLCDDYKGD